MERFVMVLSALIVGCCGLGIVGSRAQQAVFVPVCGGTNDTAAFQTIISGATSNPLTIRIPFKSDLDTRCKLTTITFPENITLDNTEGSGIVRDNPSVVTVLGRVINPAGKTLFFGTGTTSFAPDALADSNQQVPNRSGIDRSGTANDATITRLTINPGPRFDLAANTLAVGQIIPLSGTVAIPAGNTLSLIRLTKAEGGDNVVAPGNGAMASGFYSALTADAASDGNSNVYSVVAHVNNAGPGTTKGIHAEASASGSSTGPIVAGNFQIAPVATSNRGSAAIQLSLTSSGANDVANGINIFSGGDRFRVGVGSVISPVPYAEAAFRAWMGTNSSATARAFQVLNNAGTEIAYIHKDGVASFPSLSLGPLISSRPDSNSEPNQLQPPDANSRRTALTMDSYADDPGSGSSIIGRRAQGTAAIPGATRTNDRVLLIGAHGYQTTTNAFSTAPRASISMRAAENFTSTSQGMYLSFETTRAGSTTTAERLRVTDSGNAGIMTPGKGIILKSPDGNCWLTTVANGGVLKTSSVPCP